MNGNECNALRTTLVADKKNEVEKTNEDLLFSCNMSLNEWM